MTVNIEMKNSDVGVFLRGNRVKANMLPLPCLTSFYHGKILIETETDSSVYGIISGGSFKECENEVVFGIDAFEKVPTQFS